MDMLKWPMWIRVVVGTAAVFLCIVLSWLVEPYLGETSLLIFLPGGALFIYLNPELMRGKWPPDP